MPKTYPEAKGRATGPGRLAGKVEIKSEKKMMKADWVREVTDLFEVVTGKRIAGFEKLTVDNLKQMYEALSSE